MSIPTRDEQATSATHMAAGVRKRLSIMPLMMIDGIQSPPDDVATNLDKFAETQREVEHAKAIYEKALATADTQRKAMVVYMAAVVRFVRAAFGNDPVALGEFGIPPISPRPTQTVDEKAAAVAKRESTRKARGTMGPRAKLAIHGDVTGVTITPVAPPPPAGSPPAPQPAPTPVAAAATTAAPPAAPLDAHK